MDFHHHHYNNHYYIFRHQLLSKKQSPECQRCTVSHTEHTKHVHVGSQFFPPAMSPLCFSCTNCKQAGRQAGRKASQVDAQAHICCPEKERKRVIRCDYPLRVCVCWRPSTKHIPFFFPFTPFSNLDLSFSVTLYSAAAYNQAAAD